MKKQRVEVRFSSQLKDKVDRHCSQNELTVSEFIRKTVKEKLQNDDN